jgi:serine/threonine-protein kinase
MTDRTVVQPANFHIPKGTRLNGIYEIDEHLASGGMGEVYRGHAIQTGDPVAIKVIRPELADDESVLALFRKEASALHYLHNEAIVRYYVFSVDPDLLRPYLAMEFVDGPSLSDLLQNGPLKFEQVMLLKRRIGSALQAAHERGIIHRDVSPDNIIIPKGDVAQAKIIDFGIARSTQIGEGTVIGGGFAGKYNYVSPEQLGLFGGDVTGKSDIYSFGLVLAQALSGHAINMGGNQVEVIDKRRVVPPIEDIDARMLPLIEHMLQPMPEDRPDSMAMVAAWRPDNFEYADERPKYEPTSRNRRRKSETERRKSPRGSKAAIAAGLAVLVLGGAGYAVYQFQDEVFPETKPTVTADNAPKLPEAGPSAPLAGGASQQGVLSPSPAGAPPSAAQPAPPRPGPRPGDVATAARPPAETPPSQGVPPPAVPPIAAAPPPATEAALGPVEKITRFINQYDGGDCFFATPVSIAANVARVEGYGSSVAPFDVFDYEFKRAMGFEADIGVRQVTKAQCPAVTFLAGLRGDRGPVPVIELTSSNVRAGAPLAGKISGYGTRNIGMLLVADDGIVHNLTSALKTAGDTKTFNAPLPRRDDGIGLPQLLIVLSSALPLDALKTNQPAAAEQLFSAIQTGLSQKGQMLNATSRYFKVER